MRPCIVVLSLLVGFLIAIVVWFSLSTLIAYAIVRAEQTFPRLVEARMTIAGEIFACLTVMLGCLGLAFWIAKVLSAR